VPCRVVSRVSVISLLLAAVVLGRPATLAAQSDARVMGRVVDETGAPLPGASVVLTPATGRERLTVTGADGRYSFDHIARGNYRLSVAIVNFATIRRQHVVVGDGPVDVSFTLHLSVTADVVVTAKGSFRNLADVAHPDESLIGLAAAASEGAVTAQQIEDRPIQRAGEVLEAVPGVIISQHSGEGKANQYYLRGFNLDHGTDFATTVAGLPVNMPTHAHGQGYSDVNFLIPELVTGVQYRKGPYYAESGDFSAAGSATISYANILERPVAAASAGQEGWGRVLLAASPRAFGGVVLAALELNHNDGPWTQPDDYRKINGVLRYSRTAGAQAFSLTGLFYRAGWHSTDQAPGRAIAAGTLDRFGAVDETDGGRTARASAVGEYQHTGGGGLTRATAYVSRYRLNLFSNFTYFLDDPVNGDQFEQADRRWVSGARVTHRRLSRLGGRFIESIVGVEARDDAIPSVGLYHTAARARLDTVREDAVHESAASAFAEATLTASAWLRATGGLRIDGYRFHVTSSDPANSGLARSVIASPKGGLIFGPWRSTEFYVNAGEGFHSNDARGVAITRDPSTGDAVQPVTPLVRARGAEVGLRSVAIPRVQTTLAVWRLGLASELLFVGDAGTTEESRPSHRYGVESATYVRLAAWLKADADIAWSHARFTDAAPVGNEIPGAADLIAAAGLTVEPTRRVSGSVRLRYFGPRPLIEDGSVRSSATSLLNAQGGWRFSPRVRFTADLFNLLDAEASDVDYFYPSRLPGEPDEGVDDIHTHPALPRTLRLGLEIAF
jgi:TonB dependent receptor-like, beta-barrel/Carboxypeptidase regulatory-like domain/TonB-dependent Receptor Plug Domain